MSTEFTGKQRERYAVTLSLTRQRMVEHVTEGWIPLPGDRERVESCLVIREFTELNHALDLYNALIEAVKDES